MKFDSRGRFVGFFSGGDSVDTHGNIIRDDHRDEPTVQEKLHIEVDQSGGSYDVARREASAYYQKCLDLRASIRECLEAIENGGTREHLAEILERALKG